MTYKRPNLLSSRTQATGVPCPACKAGAGEVCVGARDKPRVSCHKERHHALLTPKQQLRLLRKDYT